MKDIYKSAFKSRKVKKNITETSVDMPIVVKVPIQRIEIPTTKKEVKAYPEVQSVKVINPQKAPDVQKVEITNPTPQKEIVIPDTVKISNASEIAKHIVIPDTVKISNPTPQINIPISKGNKPGDADPERYVPVRLTNGRNFINGMGDQFVAAAKSAFPYVNKTSGKPQAATVDDAGIVQTTTGSATVTTTSGAPLDVTIRNIPTIQTVNVQNMPTISVTTASGQPGLNFPTVQTVAVQSMPTISVATASGQPGLNFPTVQTVVVANPSSATVTTTSGTPLDVTVRDFPTVQTVQWNSPQNVQIQPGITTAISGTVTTASGFHTTIDNFPTIQKVSIADIPNITTVSGSQIDIKNFPTFQTVNVQNMPAVTSVSGTNLHVFLDNYPTTEMVKLSDGGGNLLGIPTSPVVVSGTVQLVGWTSVTYSGQTNGKQLVKATSGSFGGYYIYNPNSSVAYMQVFDALSAANVTLGTTVPNLVFGIPATSAANLEIVKGRDMQNGVVISCTTTAGGLTAPSTGLDITVLYK